MMIGQNQPPTGLLAIAGYARSLGHQVEILDCIAQQIDFKALPTRISQYNPDVVGTSAISRNVYEAMYTCYLARQVLPEVVTVVGGEHFSALPELSLRTCSEIDYLVIGEGEISFGKLLEEIELSKIQGRPPEPENINGLAFLRGAVYHQTKKRSLIEDLNQLPSTAWDLLPNDKYSWDYIGPDGTGLTTSRGCIFHCKFCSERVFWRGTWRGFSAERIVEEISSLYYNYNRRSFWIYDAEFLLSPDRNIEFIKAMESADLKDLSLLIETRATSILRDKELIGRLNRLGLKFAIVGVETANQMILNSYNKENTVENTIKAMKILVANQIVPQGQMIFGSINDSNQTFAETMNFARKLMPRPAWITLLLLTPFPGTALFYQARRRGLIVELDFSCYGYDHPIMPTRYLTIKQLEILLAKFSVLITSNPRMYLGQPHSLKTIRTIFRQFSRIAADTLTNPLNPDFLKYKSNLLARQLSIMGRDERWRKCLETREQLGLNQEIQSEKVLKGW